MTESGSSSLGSNSEIDDPGRDPQGLNPPRNLFGGGPDQDSGQGRPQDSPGIEEQGLMPEPPAGEGERS